MSQSKVDEKLNEIIRELKIWHNFGGVNHIKLENAIRILEALKSENRDNWINAKIAFEDGYIDVDDLDKMILNEKGE
jgi:hypothetical protein